MEAYAQNPGKIQTDVLSQARLDCYKVILTLYLGFLHVRDLSFVVDNRINLDNLIPPIGA